MGGIDLKTVDRIYRRGFGKKFPLRDEKEVIRKPNKALELVEKVDTTRV